MKLAKVLKNIIIVISIIILMCLTAATLLATGYFNANYDEYTLFKLDPIYITWPLILLSVICGAYVYKKGLLGKVKTVYLLMTVLVITFLFSLYWVFATKSNAIADRLFVSEAAKRFLKGDYSDFQKDQYLFWLPYQTGMVLFFEFIYKIFTESELVIKILNCFSVVVIFLIVTLISGELTEENQDGNRKAAAIMCAVCFPVMMFTTYVYSNLMGLSLGLIAVWLEIKFLKSDRAKWYIYIPIIALLAGCAAFIKNNYLIILIALACSLILDAIEKKKISSILFAVLLFAVYFLGEKIILAFCLSEVSLPVGVPKIIWVRMGLTEGFFGPGTYTGAGKILFSDCGYDVQLTTSIALNDIKSILTNFVHNPAYFCKFFAHKLAITWTEPTYMSLWESNCHLEESHYGELSSFINSAYYGWVHEAFVIICDALQSFTMLFSLVYFADRKAKKSSVALLPIITVIGGVLFHLVWETKSQYAITYFVFLMPYAACGFYRTISFLSKKLFSRGN